MTVPTGRKSPDPRRDFGAWYVTPDGNVYLIEHYGDFLTFSYGRRSPGTSLGTYVWHVRSDGTFGYNYDIDNSYGINKI